MTRFEKTGLGAIVGFCLSCPCIFCNAIEGAISERVPCGHGNPLAGALYGSMSPTPIWAWCASAAGTLLGAFIGMFLPATEQEPPDHGGRQ